MITINSYVKGAMLAAATTGLLGLSFQAGAVGFQAGNVEGSFDTTLTVGASMRTESRDSDYLTQFGNRNFDKWEVFSNSVKGTHDLEFSLSDRFGGFGRASWFYDFALDKKELHRGARNRAESHADILDAYLYGNFGAEQQFHLKAGRQVIS